MSLILDALNRAERERKKSQAVPDWQTVHEPALPSTAPTAAKKYMFPGIIIAVLALVILVYIFIAGRDSSEPVVKPMPAGAVNSARPPVAETAVPQPPTEAPPPTSQAASNATSAVPAAQAAAGAEPSETSSADLDELYASARGEESVSKDPVTSLYTETPKVAAVLEPSKESVSPPIVVAVRDYNSLIDIPDIGDLPWGFRKEIPSLNYIRHNFSIEGASSVVINSKAHYAGGNLASDLLLEEIYVDGVIFQFKQTRFKLRALNSWVNM